MVNASVDARTQMKEHTNGWKLARLSCYAKAGATASSCAAKQENVSYYMHPWKTFNSLHISHKSVSFPYIKQVLVNV